MSRNDSDFSPLVTIRDFEWGTRASEANLRLALASLSRDDSLFFCARINALVTGFEPGASHLHRQQRAVRMLCSPTQIRRLDKFAKAYERGRITVFFRGQLLELARWLALHGVNDPEDGDTFANPRNRANFARAAFIASGLWERRLFGAKGIQPNDDPYAQLVSLLGPFRKNLEDANLAPHPGFVIFRGWKLFKTYIERHLPNFGTAFQSVTRLTVEEYFMSASAILQRTFHKYPDNERVFKTSYVEGASPFAATFAQFMRIHSQTAGEWATRLGESPNEPADISLRARPILNFSGDRSIILDPLLFLENLISAPLFFAIKSGLNANLVFGAFGDAVEEYVRELLRRHYPDSAPEADERIRFGVQGENSAKSKFEIDALITDRSCSVVVEIKAAWIRDDTVLADPAAFVREMKKKYGQLPDGTDRGKGVAQLARIVGALARHEWREPQFEPARSREIFPVLLVYDRRLASPGTGNFLDTEFRAVLGSVPEAARVHPVTIVTVADVEFIVSTLGQGSLLRMIREYSAVDPERTNSFHNFILRRPPANSQTQNSMLAEITEEMLAAAKSALWGEVAPHSASTK